MGREPGQDARGQAVVTSGAFAALLGGIVLALVLVSGRRSALRPGYAFVPAAAAAYVTAHYYAFDSYYLPTLRRFCDDGSVSAVWLYAVVLAVLIAAVVVWLRPRPGLALVPPALLACGATVVAMGIGH
jgi:Kef-type K+ transport system membrane component KefB